MTVAIPRVIYTMWYARDGSDEDPPSKYSVYEESWRRHCPNYEHVLVRTSDVEYMWENEPSLREFRGVYKRMLLIEKCDYTRYALMALKGGVYRDLGMECYRNIDPLLAERDVALVREPYEMNVHAGGIKVGNQFMASVAGYPFWLTLMRHIRDNYNPAHTHWMQVLKNTGPIALGTLANALLPESAFINTCAVLPYIHLNPLRVKVLSAKCRDTPADEIYAAKIWYETGCWGTGSSCSTRFIPWRRLLLLLLIILLLVALVATNVGASLPVRRPG